MSLGSFKKGGGRREGIPSGECIEEFLGALRNKAKTANAHVLDCVLHAKHKKVSYPYDVRIPGTWSYWAKSLFDLFCRSDLISWGIAQNSMMGFAFLSDWIVFWVLGPLSLLPHCTVKPIFQFPSLHDKNERNNIAHTLRGSTTHKYDRYIKLAPPRKDVWKKYHFQCTVTSSLSAVSYATTTVLGFVYTFSPHAKSLVHFFVYFTHFARIFLDFSPFSFVCRPFAEPLPTKKQHKKPPKRTKQLSEQVRSHNK